VPEGARKRPLRSRYAVLGMLSMGLETGYEMKKHVESNLRHFWSESYGQIYPILRRLEEEGLATRTPDPRADGPRRNRHQLTEAGWQDLRDWLETPPEPQPQRHELLLKLSFGERVPVAVSIRHVRNHQELCESSLEYLQMGETVLRDKPDLHRDRDYWRLTLSYGKAIREAEIAWCRETLVRLREMEAEQLHQSKSQARAGKT